MQLEGRLAVVTGGGRGIGRGIVERFLAEGAQVAIVQRRPLDPELRDRPGVHGLEADLSDASAAREAIDRSAELLGGLDVLVNNAGMMSERAVSEISVEEWDLMLALNLRAPLFLAQAALPHLRERGGGSIVNIGSIEGIGTNPEHAAYSASKARRPRADPRARRRPRRARDPVQRHRPGLDRLRPQRGLPGLRHGPRDRTGAARAAAPRRPVGPRRGRRGPGGLPRR